jgi:dienelactone hydrolase
MPQADLLLIEKYGIDHNLSYNPDTERKDCPTQYLKNDNPEQRITDIQIVLSALRNEHTYKNIIVLGGSEGAVIANLLAAKVDYIDATISFNSGGRWFIDDILHNISSTNTNQEEVQQSIAGFKGFSEHILNSKPFEISVSGHGYHWWQQMLSIDQLDTLKKVNTPLLVVQGGSDLSVSPKKVDEMILALTVAGNNTIEYMTYEKLDHQFNNKEGKSELKDVIIHMNTWLLTKLKDADKAS